MSAAEASEALRTYPVKTFLDWLDKERIGIGGARERGCHFGALLTFEGATANEEQARQWASRFGRDIADIWGDGAIREDALKAGPTVPGSAASQVRTSPQEVRQETLCRDVMRLVGATGAQIAVAGPNQFEPCSECGRSDFRNLAGRNGHVATCKGPKPAKKVDGRTVAAKVPCPVEGCTAKLFPAVGLRNHIRNAHHRDPDDFFGVPPYRAAAQKVSVPGDQSTKMPQLPGSTLLPDALAFIKDRIAENVAELTAMEARSKELGTITEQLVIARDALEDLDERYGHDPA